MRIRVQGSGDLTLINSCIHGNDDGILVGGSTTDSDIVVDSSEFAGNGAGDEQSHNIYVSAAHSFSMRYSYSHDAIGGHLVKSRALTNNILYNRLTGQAGTSAYELDLPDGGLSYVIGKVIEQGPATTNPTMLAYAEESASNPDQHLYAVNNTFVSDRPSGGVAIHVSGSAPPASVISNIDVGGGTFVDQGTATLVSNCLPADAKFVAPATFDFHLQATSPCRVAGEALIAAGDLSP